MSCKTCPRQETSHVKFISYTGSFPNLCSGILTLEIDGKEYVFGHSCYKEKQGEYPCFWRSTGTCCFTADWDAEVIEGEWEIDVCELPDEILKYAKEIDEVFNSNVPWGCCGGCI